MKIWENLGGWKLYLGLVTLLSIAIRSIPSWIYSAWGTDFGIYYSITIEFLVKKNPFFEYPAVWGSSGYGSFPMLYIIILIAHIITGISPEQLLLKIPPIIGGLCVIPLYLIAFELTKNRKIALISAVLLAINPVHAYQTSMPYLLTIGHFFMLFSMYYFIKWLKNEKYIFYLVPLSIALLLSHHLTNYIYIISITGIAFIGGLYNYIPKNKVQKAFLFIASFMALSIAYWILRVPGMKSFMSAPFHHLIPWYGVAIIGFILLFSLYITSIKINIKSERKILKIIDSLKISQVFAIFLAISLGIFIILTLIGLHGYYVPLIAIIYSIPFMLTIGFMGVGLVRFHRFPQAFYIIGSWLLAITVSLIFGVISWSSLEPWRHIEYLMEPLSIVGAIGISIILRSDIFNKIQIKKRIKITLENKVYIPHRLFGENSIELAAPAPIGNVRPIKDPITYEEKYPIGKTIQIIFAFTIAFIILMTGITAFPFMNEIKRSNTQGISPIIMTGIQWLNENGDRNYTVATNHKIGTILEAYGFPSSFEYDYKIWNATNWIDCLDELEGLNGTYPKIGYVLITSDMYKYGVFGYNNTHNPLQPPVFMGEKGYEKFKKEPFKLIFRNANADNTEWVEIYIVDWNYINSYLQSHNLRT